MRQLLTILYVVLLTFLKFVNFQLSILSNVTKCACRLRWMRAFPLNPGRSPQGNVPDQVFADVLGPDRHGLVCSAS